MIRAAPALAKLSRPKLYRVAPRERLFALLDDRRQHPIVWVAGPPGAGKTALIATYLDARKVPGFWYQLDGGDADPATFFYYLGQAAQQAAPSKRKPLPLLTPEYLADLPEFTRRFFREFYGRLPSKGALILDNYQDVPAESAFHSVIQEGLAEIPDGINVIVISRAEPPHECARPLANDLIGQIGWEDLRLTLEETTAIAEARKEFDNETLGSLHDQSNGWAAGLVLMLERLKHTGSVNRIAQTETMDTVFNYFAGQVFDQAPAEIRDVLTRTAFLPSMTVKMAQEISGHPAAGKVLDSFYRRHLFTDRRAGVEIRYEYHALFRAFLQARAQNAFSDGERFKLLERAASLLDECGNAADALPLYVQNRSWDAATRLILKQARSLIAQGRWLTLSHWIGMLPKDHVAATPWLQLWMGNSLILINPHAARVILERVFQQFLAEKDEIGQILTATGMVESYNIEFSSFGGLDPWIAVLEGLLRRDLVFPSPSIKLRAYTALMLAALWRRPDHPMLRECVERAMAMLEEPGTVTVKADAAVQLLQYYDFSGNVSAASAFVAKAIPLLDRPELSHIRRSSWLIFVGYHSMMIGANREGLEAVERAQAIAREYGQDWVPFFSNLIRAWIYLHHGDLARAEALVDKLGSALNEERPTEVALYHLGRCTLSQLRGDKALAAHHGQLCVEAAEHTGGALFNVFCPAIVATAFIENGQHEKALELIRGARALSTGTCYQNYGALGLMVEAYSSFTRGIEREALHLLRQALELGRKTNSDYFFRWMVVGFRRMLAYALRSGIEPDYVRSLIRKFAITAESPEVDPWPWPVRVYALGTLRVEVDGEPVRFGPRAQRKPLDLLKVVIAHGPQPLDAAIVLDALWPDAEGGAARSAFDMAVMRLRKLLRRDDALRLDAGRVALDPGCVWVDAFAFAQGAIDDYPGPLFGADAVLPWWASARERLHQRFLRRSRDRGLEMESQGQLEQALALYEAGLSQDPLAEDLYQGAIRCHLAAGRAADALRAYRRCRQQLSIVLGVSPSATTSKLVAGISAR
jgi:LuxR family maltose regulon positive regulatory protein